MGLVKYQFVEMLKIDKHFVWEIDNNDITKYQNILCMSCPLVRN